MQRKQHNVVRWSLIVGTAVALLLLVAACGGDDGSEPVTEVGNVEAAAPDTAVLASPVPETAVSPTPLPTNQPPPTPTAVPTETAPPTPTPLPIPIPTLPPRPDPLYVNGIPPELIIVMPEEVVQNSRQIFAKGQRLGRNSLRFSTAGDSIAQTPQYLTWFDDPERYNLGEFAYLQPVIDAFAGSFAHQGEAMRDGLNTTAVLDPTWADKSVCEPNETPLACEIRVYNPSVMFVLFGTNDWSDTFQENMRDVVEYTIEQGVIPVIVTKANRVEGANNYRNIIMRELAAEYQVPLWDFDRIAETIPNRGVDEDQAHLTIINLADYTHPATIMRGYGLHNITALMALDSLLRDVIWADVNSNR